MDKQIRVVITQHLNKNSNSLTDSICEQVSKEFQEIFNSDFTETMRQSIYTNLMLFKDFVASDGDPRTIQPGQPLRRMAHTLAARGMPLSTLIMLFHGTHNVLEHKLLRLTHELFHEYDVTDIIQILEQLRVLANNFVRIRTNSFPAIYAEEAARLRVPGDPALLNEVRRALRAPEDVPMIMDYSLDTCHTAFHLWANPTKQLEPEELFRTAKEITEKLAPDRPSLIVHSSPSLVWGWCSLGTEPPHGQDLPVTNDEFLSIVPTECHLTITTGFTGASGFKDAHTQADRLRRVAEAQTNNERSILSSADEGALTAAAFIDRIPLAHNLIWSVLGELSGSDEYSFAIRETARSFLKNGISGAAKDMVTHRNTVKYRVDKFRDALGTRDINGAEVRLALELSHWLNNAEAN